MTKVFGICSIITRVTDKTVLEQQADTDQEYQVYKQPSKSPKREKANSKLSLRNIGVERVDLWYRASNK